MSNKVAKNNYRVLMHIGYAKAGSTWLQKEIFGLHPRIHYLGLKPPRRFGLPWKVRQPHNFREGALADMIEAFATRECPRLEPEDAAARLQRKLKPGRLNVISSENLLRPGYVSHLCETLSRLRECGIDVSVLLAVREQWKILWSRYAHDLQLARELFTFQELVTEEIRSCSFPWCIRNQTCGCRERGKKDLCLPFYDYDNTWSALVAALGKREVHVVPCEGLFNGDELTLNVLARALQDDSVVDRAKSVGQKFVNRADSTRLDVAEALNPDIDTIRARVRSHYSVSNATLDASLDVSLAKFGYACRQ